jgi:hypothetical protein
MVRTFLDKPGEQAHEAFQRWRRMNTDAVFANARTASNGCSIVSAVRTQAPPIGNRVRSWGASRVEQTIAQPIRKSSDSWQGGTVYPSSGVDTATLNFRATSSKG